MVRETGRRNPVVWRGLAPQPGGYAEAVSRALSVEALGAAIRIDGSALTDDAWKAVQSAWRDAAADASPATDAAATVTAHGGIPTPSMLSRLSIEVTLAAIKARAGELLILHAAGLALEDGRVVALIGPSGKGKSTASRVLGREFGYVSDESVGISADAAIVAYRKPLSLIEHDRLPKAQRSPSELGLRPLPAAPLHLAGLVLLDRDDETEQPRWERVDVAEGIVRLAEQASYLGRLPSPLHAIASHVDSVGGVHRLRYSDAAALPPLIRELAAREPLVTERTPRGSKGVSTPTAASRDKTRLYSRLPVIDALGLDDGRMVLLVRGDGLRTRAVVLDGIAPTLWRHTVQPTARTEMVEVAVAAYGNPEGADPAELVDAALAELVEAGVMREVDGN